MNQGSRDLHLPKRRLLLSRWTPDFDRAVRLTAHQLTPIQLASSLGWLEGVAFLVERRADLDQSDSTGETPLISAIHRRDQQMVQVLLKGGADPDRADNSGRSARDYAKLDKDGQLLSLIEANAKPRSTAGKPGSNVYGPTF